MKPFRVIKRAICAWLFVIAISTPTLTHAAEATNASLTLRDVLIQATASFQSGQYSQAIQFFEQLETTFGNEPQMKDPAIRRIILPAWGYSELATENYSGAIEQFEEYLEEFPEPGNVHSFVLISLAQSEHWNGNLTKAAQHYGEFIQTYPRLPETPLAALNQVDLLFQSQKAEEAYVLSERLFQSRAPGPLRAQSRLRALQVRLEDGERDQAAELLLSTEWSQYELPNLMEMAFAALQIGDSFMTEEDYHSALRSYRLVPPYSALLDYQRQQLQRVSSILGYRQRNPTSTMDSVWLAYYATLVSRLETQLEALESMDDYTPGFLLRYGQAFLGDGRSREARILFRNLALDDTLDSAICQQAHYRWILAEFALKRWDRTLEVAIDFQDRYPDSALAPDALYLVAQAHQEQQKYRYAIKVFDELIERFPDHKLAPRWLFTRGFNLAMLEQYEQSRADFELFARTYPGHPLTTQGSLWHALTHHFEGNYEEALAELQPLAESSRDHFLYPEIRYRIATAHYAIQDYDTARPEIEKFLADFPDHSRSPEAVVLRGDILMGQGELILASAAFAEVTPEADGLFPYAIFQRGKIFKALEMYDLMIDHFTDYLDREDLEIRPRMSEALYWLGWAYLQKGNIDAALLRFDQAFAEYGDDPAATEILPMISSLETLRSELLRNGDQALPDHSLFAAGNFSAWLDDQILLALESNRLTWYSRLKHFQANRARAIGQIELADTILQEIDEKVPLERLDPQVIGQIGIIYSAAGYQYADAYFDYILANYPDHPARAEAWFGKAEILIEEEEWEDADDLLRKFEQQMPLHPLSPQVNILRGRILTNLGFYDDAEKSFEEVLTRKDARGIPHARAIAGLAEMNEQRGNPKRAIPYWQRIYTLYRAYPEPVAEAYFRSAVLFYEIGDPTAAIRSLDEMFKDERLLNSPFAAKAIALRRELQEEMDTLPAPVDTPPSTPVEIQEEPAS